MIVVPSRCEGPTVQQQLDGHFSRGIVEDGVMKRSVAQVITREDMRDRDSLYSRGIVEDGVMKRSVA